jgi:hypothetical protein
MLMAMEGDTPMLRVLLDRVLPRRRELTLKLGSLPMETPADLAQSSELIMQQLAQGKITITDAERIASML